MSLIALKLTEAGGSVETDAKFVGHLIADREDEPAEETPPITAAQLKAAFDYLSTTVLGPLINDVIDILAGVTVSDSGAANIGLEAITGVTGATVRAALIDLKSQIDGVAAGAIPAGSITDTSLSAAAGNILARYAAHVLDYATHIRYLGTTGGTLTAYTATDAGFSFNTANVNLFIVRAHVDCGASPTFNINGGGAKTIKPNAAASLTAGQMKANGEYLLVWYPTTPATMYILNPETISLTLEIASITGLQTALDGKSAAAHTHTMANITDLAAALALKAASAHSHAEADVTGLTAALAAKQATITGGASSIVTSNLTANRALTSDASGKVVASAVSDAELGHLDGVTSALQTQLNGKLGSTAQAADSHKVDGHHVFVQSATPTASATGDIWIETA